MDDAIRAKILELLGQHRLMTIATNRPDGCRRLRTTPNGRQEAYDIDRRYQGYFDTRNDLTKDSGGATVAKGNAVATLIFGRR